MIDGQLRQRAALECGQNPPLRTLTTEREAAQVLWSLHPERALRRFAPELTLRQCCELFAARPRDVMPVLNRCAPLPPKPPPKVYKTWKTGRANVHLPGRLRQRLADVASTYRVTQKDVIVAALDLASDEDLLTELEAQRREGRNAKLGRGPYKKQR